MIRPISLIHSYSMKLPKVNLEYILLLMAQTNHTDVILEHLDFPIYKPLNL